MIKKGFEGIVFSGAIPVGLLLILGIQGLFNYKNEQEFYQSISIIMLSLFLSLIIILLFFFVRSYYQDSQKDRIRSLIGRKVYTRSGDYVGIIKDLWVSVKIPMIYGIKVVVSLPKRKSKKITIRAKNVRSYGEVVLIDSAILDKI